MRGVNGPLWPRPALPRLTLFLKASLCVCIPCEQFFPSSLETVLRHSTVQVRRTHLSPDSALYQPCSPRETLASSSFQWDQWHQLHGQRGRSGVWFAGVKPDCWHLCCDGSTEGSSQARGHKSSSCQSKSGRFWKVEIKLVIFTGPPRPRPWGTHQEVPPRNTHLLNKD